MQPATRTQVDGRGDEISDATATTPTGESLTRQELAPDTDINTLLARFGVDGQMRQPIYGETIDYDMNLQTAINITAQAQDIMHHVPQELRDKYRNWREVLDATETGQYQADLKELQARKKAASEAPTPQVKPPSDTPEVTPKP